MSVWSKLRWGVLVVSVSACNPLAMGAGVPGFGTSSEAPKGAAFSLPSGVQLAGDLTGVGGDGCDPAGVADASENVLGSGSYVQVCVPLENTSDTEQRFELPCGFIFVSKGTDVQNGLLLQRTASIVVPAHTRVVKRVHAYCMNLERHSSDEGSRFTLGPVSEEEEVKELCELLRDKQLPTEGDTVVQDALWNWTDGPGLSDEDRDALRNL